MSAAPPRRDLLILLLALAGAGVDAVVILGFNVLTAAQTGNTILFAVALAQGQVAVGVLAAVSVAGYVLGVAAGESMLIVHRRARPQRSGLSVALAVECVVLACLVLLWRRLGANPPPHGIAALVALAALAMGVQSTVVLRLHAGTTTTYITGMLTTFASDGVRWLLAPTISAEAQVGAASGRGTSCKAGLTWVVYAAGAVASGVLFLRVHELALLVPVTSVLGVAMFAVLRREAPDAGRERESWFDQPNHPI